MPAILHLIRNVFGPKTPPLPALKCLRTLSNHTGTISTLVFLPDNKHLVSGSHGGTIRVWDVEGGGQIELMHHGSGVTAMVASSDGTFLVSGGADGTVAFWGAARWTKTLTPSRKHASSIRAMSVSADSKQLATVSDDQTVLIWSTSTGEVTTGPLEGYQCGILSVTFSPDAAQLATGAEDGTIRIWNLVLGKPVGDPLAISAGGRAVLSLAWLGPKHLVSAAYKSIMLVNSVTGLLLYERRNAHAGWIRSIAGYYGGRCMATGAEDGHVVLWDVVDGFRQLADGYASDNEVYAVAVSPDGSCLAGGYRDHKIRLWSLLVEDD